MNVDDEGLLTEETFLLNVVFCGSGSSVHVPSSQLSPSREGALPLLGGGVHTVCIGASFDWGVRLKQSPSGFLLLVSSGVFLPSLCDFMAGR